MSLQLLHPTVATKASKLTIGDMLLVLGHFYKVAEVPMLKGTEDDNGQELTRDVIGSANLVRNLTNSVQSSIILQAFSNYQVVELADVANLMPKGNEAKTGTFTTGDQVSGNANRPGYVPNDIKEAAPVDAPDPVAPDTAPPAGGAASLLNRLKK